ncbi:hypothetical protein DCAR_0206038 [Daucus carota subsp. sativus]|uniref:Uncharacterized protein n=1 Tax=Daucus carota subsp. sativus TaxID=79200 RepID=A0A166D004_DAUCS|nr:hypothetical protein DCAR_0206038 [Daucus carota subsp. sativus]
MFDVFWGLQEGEKDQTDWKWMWDKLQYLERYQ